jgi:hypothetical protein
LTLYSEAGVPATLAKQGGAEPGGGQYAYPNAVAIDEAGRVMFIHSLTNGSNALFLWENGQTQRLLTQGATGPNGLTVNSLIRVVAAGTKFYLRADCSAANGQNNAMILEYSNGAWRTVIQSGEILGNSLFVNWGVGSNLAVNASGQVAWTVQTPQGPGIVVRQEGVPDRIVAVRSEKGPSGEWFTDLYQIAINGTGEVFFLANTWDKGVSRPGLYHATPQ